ncbi:MAG: DUF4199 family protein [Bacteroidota bacterium]
MRPSIKIALLFAGIWFLVRMCFFQFQIFQNESGVKILILWNLFCLLMAITIGTLVEKLKEKKEGKSAEGSAFADIKEAMRGGMIYTVLVAGLIYLYYGKIDPAYNERQLARIGDKYMEEINDPKQLAIFKSNPENASLTKEEIYAKAMEGPKSFYNPGSTMILSLLGMLLLTTVNAIVVTVVFRRVLFKQRTL